MATKKKSKAKTKTANKSSKMKKPAKKAMKKAAKKPAAKKSMKKPAAKKMAKRSAPKKSKMNNRKAANNNKKLASKKSSSGAKKLGAVTKQALHDQQKSRNSAQAQHTQELVKKIEHDLNEPHEEHESILEQDAAHASGKKHLNLSEFADSHDGGLDERAFREQKIRPEAFPVRTHGVSAPGGRNH